MRTGFTRTDIWERSGSVVECLTGDRRAAGSSLTGVTVLWSLSKTHFPSLVLVKPRKTHPYITERLLMGRKESNQTNHALTSGCEVYHAKTDGTILYKTRYWKKIDEYCKV